MQLYVTYSEESVGGEPVDDSRWSSRTDRIINFNLTGVSLEEPNIWSKESFEIDCLEIPKIVYVVLVRYSDGDTFGHSIGNGKIEGVFLSEDEAENVVNAIRNKTYSRRSSEENQKISNKKTKSFFDGEIFEWNSYFSSLESVNYHPIMVRKYAIK